MLAEVEAFKAAHFDGKFVVGVQVSWLVPVGSNLLTHRTVRYCGTGPSPIRFRFRFRSDPIRSDAMRCDAMHARTFRR